MSSKNEEYAENTEAPMSSSAFAFDNDIDEPSPLDRILSDGRNYNAGNWTSDELKKLFDGVHKYGTSKGAMTYCQTLLKERNEMEIKAKIDEMREIIKEHKETILPEFYHKHWIDQGHRNIGPPLDSDVNVDESWSSVCAKVTNHHHQSLNKRRNPMREALERSLQRFSEESESIHGCPITSLQTARTSCDDSQSVRWPIIYEFMQACSTLEEQLPEINELEAAIILKVVDTIEDEASTISDKDKAIMLGVFTECQLGDFRFCEQDWPADIQSGFQLYVDPLRTRAHGVPDVAAEVEIPSTCKPSTSSK